MLSEQTDLPKPGDSRQYEAAEPPSPKISGKMAQFHYQWAAPLPPPEVLRQYESLLPGAAQRLFDQYDKQANHRMQMEADMAPTIRKAILRGQWMASFLMLSALVLSAALAFWGYRLEVILAVGGLVILPVAVVGTALVVRSRRADPEPPS